MEIYTYILLILAAFAAGFVDAIAGGGGIITIPALLAAGLPAHLALGTNKLQACFGSFTAAANYTHKGLVKPLQLIDGIVWTALGAIAGTIAVQKISQATLEFIIPVMLIVIFFYMLLSPKMGFVDCKARMKALWFYFIMGLAIGFYDGFFGPGTGSFWTIAFVSLLGFNLRKATAHTKIMNFTSNIISMLVFVYAGCVYFGLGLLMGLAQAAGAYLGSRMVISKGTAFVRVFFLTVVAITIARLIYKSYF